MTAGFVSLVGAGPGDPDLLTMRAVRRLQEADVVFHDALVHPGVLALVPDHVRRVCVGKRGGRPSTSQRVIDELLVRAARSGHRVVRLKCGDPFVLGRGGEEALVLEAAGLAYEVVPGITSAVAAPAAAGIPVTHRGLASGFVVVSGHAERAYAPVLGSLAPGSATVVALMGVATRGDIARCLIERGWEPATPAALVFGAHGPDEQVVPATLTQLATDDPVVAQEVAGTAAPGLLVVGAVTALAAELRTLAARGPLPEVATARAAAAPPPPPRAAAAS